MVRRSAIRGSSQRLRASALIAALLLVCSTVPSGAQSPPPDDHGTLRVGLAEGSRPTLEQGYQVDPALFGQMRVMRCCLARTLMAYPGLPILEGGTVLHPDLAAEPPEVSPDGLRWTFRLRPDIRYQPPFEDRRVVAADIIRAIERSLRIDPELAAWFEPLEGVWEYALGEAPIISGIESADPLSLTFRLTEPDGNYGHVFSDPTTAPIPEGAADGFDPYLPSPPPGASEEEGFGQPDFEMPFGRRYVSTGPYMWETYPAADEGDHLALVRNPSWDPATDPLRPAIPDRIEIVMAPSPDALYEMVEAGTVDIADQAPGTERIERFRRDPDLADRLHVGLDNSVVYIPMNLAVPPFDDVAVRRAVNAVMDRAALMEAHVDGREELLGLSLPGQLVHHVFPDHLTAGLLASYDPFPSKGGRGSVSAGRAEMARSRYDTDGDGRCDAAVCRDVTVAVDFPAMGEILREGLAEIGIEATVVPMSDEVDMSVPGTRTGMQASWYTWGYSLRGGDLNDLFRGGDALETDFIGNQSLLGATPEQLAAWGYEVTDVPSVDRLISRCDGESGNRRARCWAELDQHLSETIVPGLPVYSWAFHVLVSPRVRSVKFDPSMPPTFLALDRTELHDDAPEP